MNWEAFHLCVLFFTIINAHGGVRGWLKMDGHSCHITGADLLAWAWVASWFARVLFKDISPINTYIIIDCVMIVALGRLMVKHKAVWAAICVLLHGGMILAHAFHFLTHGNHEYLYLTTLGTLTFLAALTLNIAIWSGRYAWGEGFDNFFSTFSSAWTFSGLVRPRAVADK